MTDSGSDPAPGPETVAARWTRLNGRPAGFDYMRLVLATLVLLAHSYQVTYGTEASFALWHGPAGLGLQMILPMFFSLRVHPGSSCRFTELSNHEADRGPSEECEAVLVEAFPILG